MIRVAQLGDLPAIEELLLKFKRYTEYRTVKVEFERARKVARQCISSALGFARLAEHEGRITGVLFGVMAPYWFSRERFATDIVFYSQRFGDGRLLLLDFKEWADARGARLQMAQSSGKNQAALDRFYRGFGLVRVGGLYIGEKPINVRMGQLVKQAS